MKKWQWYMGLIIGGIRAKGGLTKEEIYAITDTTRGRGRYIRRILKQAVDREILTHAREKRGPGYEPFVYKEAGYLTFEDVEKGDKANG